MTNREIDQMVRQANPVPDLSILEPHQQTDAERSSERVALEIQAVQTQSPRPLKSLEPRSRKGRPVAVALMVVAAIGLLMMVDSGISSLGDKAEDVAAVPQSEDELTATQAEALELIGEFLDARSRGVDGLVDMLSLVDDSAEIGWGFGSSWASVRNTLRWEDAVQLSYTIDDCAVAPVDGDHVDVRCTLDQDSPMAEVLGEALEPAVVDFTVLGDQITAITFDEGNFDEAVWFPFRNYMIAKHRDEVGQFFSSTKDGWPPKQQKTGFLFWALRVDEFIEYYQNPPPPASLRNVLGTSDNE